MGSLVLLFMECYRLFRIYQNILNSSPRICYYFLVFLTYHKFPTCRIWMTSTNVLNKRLLFLYLWVSQKPLFSCILFMFGLRHFANVLLLLVINWRFRYGLYLVEIVYDLCLFYWYFLDLFVFLWVLYVVVLGERANHFNITFFPCG